MRSTITGSLLYGGGLGLQSCGCGTRCLRDAVRPALLMSFDMHTLGAWAARTPNRGKRVYTQTGVAIDVKNHVCDGLHSF